MLDAILHRALFFAVPEFIKRTAKYAKNAKGVYESKLYHTVFSLSYPPVTPVILFKILIFRSPPSTPFTPVPYLVLLQIAEQQHDIEDADNSAYEQQQPFGGRAVSVVAHYLWGRGQIDLQENGPGKLDAQQHLGVNKSLERIRDEENDD